LQNGANPNLQNDQGLSLLNKHHSFQLTLSLIMCCIQGETPLHWAAHAGDVKIVQLLMNHGADPSIKG
jgi:hypothetical protein